MPNPQDLSSYEFQSNPYLEMLGIGGAGQAPQQGMPQGGTPQGAGPEMAGVMASQPGMQEEMGTGQPQPGLSPDGKSPINQLEPGQNPDRTKFLMGAVQSLEKFITESDTKEDIMLARGIVSAISRLIARDQERFAQEF